MTDPAAIINVIERVSRLEAELAEARAALKLMCAARDSYCNEFNPGNKVKAVADWGLINEAWCEADRILKTG